MSDSWSLGIDLGGTKTYLAKVRQNGAIESHFTFLTNAQSGYKDTLSNLISNCQIFIEKCKSFPASIGVGVAGQVEPLTGVISFAPNLKWSNAPLKRDLESSFSLPVNVLNDVQAATWAEKMYSFSHVSSLLGVFIGTGIGGGFVSNGQLLKGYGGSFGEIGHMAVAPNGPVCQCGRKGCLEAVAGGKGLERQAKQRLLQNPNSAPILLELIQNDVDRVTAILLFKAYEEGDPLATELIENALQALYSALSSLINILNPELIVFGGGAMKGYIPFFDMITERAKDNALPIPGKKVQFALAKIKENSAAIGAASLGPGCAKSL